jgi:hypothetical protein
MQAYRGKENFSPEQAFVQEVETGNLLSLEPLIFVDRCSIHTLTEGAEPHWYIFDKYDEKNNVFSFKAVGYACSLEIGESDVRSAVFEALRELYTGDQDVALIEANEFADVEQGYFGSAKPA